MKTQLSPAAQIDHRFIHSAMSVARSVLATGQRTGRLNEREMEVDGWSLSGYPESFFLNFPALRNDSGKSWIQSPIAVSIQVIGDDKTPSRIVVSAYYGVGAEKVGNTIQVYFDEKTGEVTNVHRMVVRNYKVGNGGGSDWIIGGDYSLDGAELEEGDRAFLLEAFPAFMHQ